MSKRSGSKTNKKPIEEIPSDRFYPIEIEDVFRIVRAELNLKRTQKKLNEIEQSRKDTSKKGAEGTNKRKRQAVEARQKKIKDYLIDNPNPKLKGYSLAGFLIKTLELKKPNGEDQSEKTISRDLKKIKLDKR